MVQFIAKILKFGRKGEKTGWNYIEISKELADKIKKDTRRGFRVRGRIDELEVAGIALLPMGDGNFILPINTPMRKKLNKGKDDLLTCFFEEDADFKIEMPFDLENLLINQIDLYDRFLNLSKSNRNYFIKYIDAAKTEITRKKRIDMTLEAVFKNFDFGKMIREEKKNRLE